MDWLFFKTGLQALCFSPLGWTGPLKRPNPGLKLLVFPSLIFPLAAKFAHKKGCRFKKESSQPKQPQQQLGPETLLKPWPSRASPNCRILGEISKSSARENITGPFRLRGPCQAFLGLGFCKDVAPHKKRTGKAGARRPLESFRGACGRRTANYLWILSWPTCGVHRKSSRSCSREVRIRVPFFL